MFVLLMINTWWNYRSGFRAGARGGHLVGVHDTLEFIMEKADITATVAGENNRPATLDELTVYTANQLMKRRMERLEQQES